MSPPRDMVIPGWAWAPSEDGPYASSFATREEAIEAGTYHNEGAPFYIAPTRPIGVTVDADNLVESVNERLCGDFGFEDYIVAPTQDQQHELDAAINSAVQAWLTKHGMLEGHFGIENVERVTPPVGKDGAA